MRMSLAIKLAPGKPGLRGGGEASRIDRDPLHLGDVNDQTVVDHGQARGIMASPANRRVDVLRGGEAHCSLDILGAATARDSAWAAINHGVPDFAGSFVFG